jgi:hypothetical protein
MSKNEVKTIAISPKNHEPNSTWPKGSDVRRNSESNPTKIRYQGGSNKVMKKVEVLAGLPDPQPAANTVPRHVSKSNTQRRISLDV